MKIETGIRVAKQLKNIGGEKAVAIAIIDEMDQYNRNFDELGYVVAQKRLSDKSRFILSLGFSEFLTQESTDVAYCVASEKAEVFRSMVGVDILTLTDELNRLYGIAS